jgi:hypothetical protein
MVEAINNIKRAGHVKISWSDDFMVTRQRGTDPQTQIIKPLNH